MAKITAFTARSFAARDEQKIQPILKHLDSFRDLGFVWKSAEPAEAERVDSLFNIESFFLEKVKGKPLSF